MWQKINFRDQNLKANIYYTIGNAGLESILFWLGYTFSLLTEISEKGLCLSNCQTAGKEKQTQKIFPQKTGNN